VYKVSIFEYDKEKEEKKLRKAERECGREEGREEGRMEERKSLLALIAKMSAGGDADKIIRLEDPEVMNAMQKKYEIKAVPFALPVPYLFLPMFFGIN